MEHEINLINDQGTTLFTLTRNLNNSIKLCDQSGYCMAFAPDEIPVLIEALSFYCENQTNEAVLTAEAPIV